jgi:hypothetical protein
MGDYHVGAQARLMSQALRKLTATVHKTNTTCVFINQLREKVGVIFGSPEVTPGGRALKFYSSVRIDLRRSESIKIGEDLVKIQIKLKKIKKKLNLKLDSPTPFSKDYVREILKPLTEEKDRLREKANQLKESHNELATTYCILDRYQEYMGGE